jgi:hypothetical protein
VLLAVKAAPPAAIAPTSTTTATILLEMRCICILLAKPWSWVVTVGQLLAPLRKERLSVAGVIVRFP